MSAENVMTADCINNRNTQAPADGEGKKQAETERFKFITFLLNGEHYAIDITSVYEIVIMPEITPVPNTPFYIMGVINLRGNIIQIVDMRLKLSMPFKKYDDKTCIVIIKAGGSTVGIVVDRVMEVISESADKIEELPAFGLKVDTGYIKGIVKIGGTIKFILNFDTVFKDSGVENPDDNE